MSPKNFRYLPIIFLYGLSYSNNPVLFLFCEGCWWWCSLYPRIDTRQEFLRNGKQERNLLGHLRQVKEKRIITMTKDARRNTFLLVALISLKSLLEWTRILVFPDW